ncbi:hypothetical protein [Streptomyces sp. AK04-3B]|uniref:hypothetical protein n=1 Tax=unclassified Streptomyces TaxID=2593676 RepID=UPI0029A425B0|nr:hypothetical protein [Streptomyces sp. AK04-3B]MDX3804518.1 hypothetical protein [Streptomyces sp. AK04-3B]
MADHRPREIVVPPVEVTCGAAGLAHIQPGAYRQQFHPIIGQARRTATGHIRGRHLAVLLDAAREDLGGARPPSGCMRCSRRSAPSS